MSEIAQLDTRLTKVEFEISGFKEDLGVVAKNLDAFRHDWTAKAEQDRIDHRKSRLSLPQIVSMISAAAVATGLLIGGVIYLINSQVTAAQSSLNSQVAQVGLTVSGQSSSLTATQQALQALQAEMARAQVAIGLVDQVSRANARGLAEMSHYDADLARLDERIKAGKAAMDALTRGRPPP